MCKIEDQQQSPETGVLTDHYVEPILYRYGTEAADKSI